MSGGSVALALADARRRCAVRVGDWGIGIEGDCFFVLDGSLGIGVECVDWSIEL